MARGELFILSAPSGSGKSTLVRNLLKADPGGIAFSVSHTTRPPRQGEVEGREYFFTELATFERKIAADHFLEWAEVHNNYYGTANDQVLPRLAAGIDVIMDIDVQGAERVMARLPTAHGIFIMPPSFAALEERLRRRGLDDPQVIQRRLAVSLWEIKQYGKYQHVIINDDAERASEALASIVRERRQRRERMQDAVDRVLADFTQATTGFRTPHEAPAHADA
ncbi:MAG: guanylate kinase [Thermoanaerobaculia bacterium]|nr:guanylate kinase [Thermoanaerobaculia bacterium]